MDARIAVDAKPEAFVGHLVQYAFAELDNVLLKGLVARWVIEDFSNYSGIARPQYVLFRHAD
jgi:hypothetical protein